MAKEKFSDIIESDLAVLVDFSATWCEPCKALHPILKDVANHKVPNTRIVKIDIDKNPNTAARFNVKSVPTMILFRNGEIKWRQSGVVPAQNIITEMRKYA
jgi:thioredoxin 1